MIFKRGERATISGGDFFVLMAPTIDAKADEGFVLLPVRLDVDVRRSSGAPRII
jgi:hypothetical protein